MPYAVFGESPLQERDPVLYCWRVDKGEKMIVGLISVSFPKTIIVLKIIFLLFMTTLSSVKSVQMKITQGKK